jgi:hypothetical protein
MSRAKRHDEVSKFVQDIVGVDVIAEVSTLVLLPPAELEKSLANMVFEDPLPSHR